MADCLVDYHCHLDLYPDFENIIDECEKNKVHTLAVTTTPRAFPKNYELTAGKEFVRAALGLHPQLVESRSAEIEIWREYFDQTRFIGEIGLDAGSKYYRSFQKQKDIFNTILETCSMSKDKILSIHSIRSAPIVLEMIEKSGVLTRNRAVLHWFSGEISSLQKAVSLGCYFSVNSEMLKTPRSRELVKQIPLGLLLTETDGPFTITGQSPSRPIHVSQTISLLSTLLNKPTEATSEIIFSNLQKLEG